MNGNNLHAASSQWMSRPADQRFWTLADMHAACVASRDGSRVAKVPFTQLRAEAVDGRVALVEPKGNPAHFTHYAFGQLASAAGAPAGYLRELPADIAAPALSASLTRAAREDKGDRNILFHQNGQLTARAILSDRYDRVWDADVVAMLMRLGWRAPAGRTPPGYDGPSRAATAEDILPGQINITPGTMIAPSGLYASDHDMFAFLVAPDRVISDGNGGTLMRGIMAKNSEVGDASLSFTFFLCQAICGNHIIWNASGVHDIKVRHIGQNTMRKAFRSFEAELRTYHDAAAHEEGKILAARSMVLGSKKEDVLDAVLKYAKTHSLPLSRKLLAEGYDTAADHSDWYGSPNTVWGVVAGLTHASQATGYADDRNAVDKAAGKLLEMAF